MMQYTKPLYYAQVPVYLLNEPPMEIKASGMVTEVISPSVLSMKEGNVSPDLEKTIPARHPKIKGLEIRAFTRCLKFCRNPVFSPEYQIKVVTASTLIMGMAKPIKSPKY